MSSLAFNYILALLTFKMIKETRQRKICLYRKVNLKEAPNY